MSVYPGMWIVVELRQRLVETWTKFQWSIVGKAIKKRNFSEMREYFCAKFCSFVLHTVHKSDISCHIYNVRQNDGKLNLKNKST